MAASVRQARGGVRRGCGGDAALLFVHSFVFAEGAVVVGDGGVDFGGAAEFVDAVEDNGFVFSNH